jgi:hypothetical protein
MGLMKSKEAIQRIKQVIAIRRDSRFLRWIEGSRSLERIEPMMLLPIQVLGQLDVELIQDDQPLTALALEQRSSSNASISNEERVYLGISFDTIFKDQLTLSYLWVLGAYELVRAIDQRCRGNPLLFGNQLNTKVTAVKHAFERLRVPLAKFESSRRHRKTDSPIAWPAIHQELGTSWQVARDVFISRKELSDILLDLLEEMRKLSEPARQ